MPDSDETMLEMITRDPSEGLRLVMDTYGPQLLGRLHRKAEMCKYGDAHVEDVFQEAILSLVDPKVRQALVDAGGAILPWLTRRGYWRLQDEYRRDLRLHSAQGIDLPIGTCSSRSELVLAIEKLLPEMSERDQEILRQHYGENLTYTEVAEAAGISKAAGKKAIHDAKRRLQRRLVDAGYRIEGDN